MTERARHRKLPIRRGGFKTKRDGPTRFGPSHCYVAFFRKGRLSSDGVNLDSLPGEVRQRYTAVSSVSQVGHGRIQPSRSMILILEAPIADFISFRMVSKFSTRPFRISSIVSSSLEFSHASNSIFGTNQSAINRSIARFEVSECPQDKHRQPVSFRADEKKPRIESGAFSPPTKAARDESYWPIFLASVWASKNSCGLAERK